MNWNEFLNMGGYAFYVWSSWGISALVILYLFAKAKLSNVNVKAQISRQIKREKLQQSESARELNS